MKKQEVAWPEKLAFVLFGLAEYKNIGISNAIFQDSSVYRSASERSSKRHYGKTARFS